jgi:integrase
VGWPIARALPKPSKPLRLRLLTAEQVAERYRRWTAGGAHPPEALVGLLALVHCLRSGELRTLALSSVVGRDRLRVGSRIVHLAEPVAEALARYLTWRAERYAGPSTYLLVSRASRLHDRPVSRCWLQENVLGGITVASLRQTAIQHLIQGSGCDGLQLASYARLSLDAVGVYMRAFDAPAPWPVDGVR